MRAVAIFGVVCLALRCDAFSHYIGGSTRCIRHVSVALRAKTGLEKNSRVAVNKSARRNYEVLEDMECGIEMTGTEVS